MRRRDDWPQRLDALVCRLRDEPFAWGRHDCAMAACAAVEAVLGHDPGARFRGRYRDALEARCLLRGQTFLSFVRARCREQGFRRIPPSRAQRGDLIVARAPDATLGFVALDGSAMLATHMGLLALPVTDCTVAWRVG